MNHLSLFSGIGGFDLAAQWMGWHNVAHCENDPKAMAVLQKRFPNSISINDVRDIYRYNNEYRNVYGDREVMWCDRHNKDFGDCACIGCSQWDDEVGAIDIITAGVPCQPFSNNGKQKGVNDERNMWPETIRIISSLSPRWFVGENVPGLVSWDDGRYFSAISSQLKRQGYQVWPVLIPASSVGAEHKRERVWIIAHNSGMRVQGLRPCGEQKSHPLDRSLLSLRHSNGEWQTEPDLRRTHDGLPRKMDRLKLIGNAIVPQVAYQIFKTIEAYEIQ